MADVAQIATEQPQERAGAAPSAIAAPEAAPFDESLLVRVKGRPKRPVRPDEAERNIPVAKLQAEITKHGDRIKEIKELIDLKRSAGRSVGAGGSDSRSRMQQYKNEFQAILRQKQHIRDELQAVNKQRETLRNETRAIRDKMRIIPEQELEERIQKLEFDLSHSSMSAADEKRSQQQLQQLQSQRPALRQYYVLDGTFKENEITRAEITKRLQQCDEALNEIKAREEAEKAALESVKAKADEETSDVPTLVAEKQECWAIMQALRDKITEIRNSYDQKWKEFVTLDRNYEKWQRWDRQQKAEESRKERAARFEEKKASDVTLKAELYDTEVYTCDQTLAYLRKFVAAESTKAAADVKPLAAPEGMKLFKRRDVEEDISMVVAPKKKGNAPKGLAAQQAAARAAEEATSSKAAAANAAATPKSVKMNNNLETLKTFMSLAIDPPNTTADVPATIEKVEAKKQHYLELRKKAKEAPAPVPDPPMPVAAEEPQEEASPVPADAEAEANGNGTSTSRHEEEDVAKQTAEPPAEEAEATPEAATADQAVVVTAEPDANGHGSEAPRSDAGDEEEPLRPDAGDNEAARSDAGDSEPTPEPAVAEVNAPAATEAESVTAAEPAVDESLTTDTNVEEAEEAEPANDLGVKLSVNSKKGKITLKLKYPAE